MLFIRRKKAWDLEICILPKSFNEWCLSILVGGLPPATLHLRTDAVYLQEMWVGQKENCVWFPTRNPHGSPWCSGGFYSTGKEGGMGSGCWFINSGQKSTNDGNFSTTCDYENLKWRKPRGSIGKGGQMTEALCWGLSGHPESLIYRWNSFFLLTNDMRLLSS